MESFIEEKKKKKKQKFFSMMGFDYKYMWKTIIGHKVMSITKVAQSSNLENGSTAFGNTSSELNIYFSFKKFVKTSK